MKKDGLLGDLQDYLGDFKIVSFHIEFLRENYFLVVKKKSYGVMVMVKTAQVVNESMMLQSWLLQGKK